MYCPNCGTQNVEDINFCRSCGLDLSTIARAMEKHLPQSVLEKIDEKVLNPKKNNLYASILNLSASTALLFIAILLSSWDYPRDALYFFIGSFFGFVGTIWYFLIYIRARSKTKMVLTTSDYIELNRLADEKDAAAKELTTAKIPVSSVAEAKTTLLNNEDQFEKAE